MSHTAYWYQKPIPADRWALIAADARKLVEAAPKAGITLLRDYDEPGTAPDIDDEQILFNGAGSAGHESFVLTRNQEPGRSGDGFVFCKTAHKPYDRVVCAILARAKHHAPDQIIVSSDGDEDNWREPLAWAAEVLGEPVALPFTEEEAA